MDRTLHLWLYSLIYPAFLGAVLVNLLPRLTSNGPVDGALAWSLVLAFYFATQHGEGVGEGARYSYCRFAKDVLELAAMITTFGLLGLLGLSVTQIEGANVLAQYSAIAAFAIPPGYRLLRKPDGKRVTLSSGLSLVAVAATFLGFQSVWGAVAVLIVLGFYVVLVIARRAETIKADKRAADDAQAQETASLNDRVTCLEAALNAMTQKGDSPPLPAAGGGSPGGQ